jgi:hypothetical protein
MYWVWPMSFATKCLYLYSRSRLVLQQCTSYAIGKLGELLGGDQYKPIELWDRTSACRFSGGPGEASVKRMINDKYYTMKPV